jgi:hypothetical protein
VRPGVFLCVPGAPLVCRGEIGGPALVFVFVASDSDRCQHYAMPRAVHDAFVCGDVAAMKAALGNPPDFPPTLRPSDLAIGDDCLEYFIRRGRDTAEDAERIGFSEAVEMLNAFHRRRNRKP